VKTKQDIFKQAAANMLTGSFGACDSMHKATGYGYEDDCQFNEVRDTFAKMFKPKKAPSYYFGKAQLEFSNSNAESKARQRRVDALLLAAVAYKDFE
jgi:hypothetical protein